MSHQREGEREWERNKREKRRTRRILYIEDNVKQRKGSEVVLKIHRRIKIQNQKVE